MKEREIKVNELLEHLLEDIVDGSKLSSIKFWFEDEYRPFNEEGITKAMVLAITKDRVDIVKFLVDQKIGFDERSVVEAVHKHKNMDIIQLLKENGISNFDKEPTLEFIDKEDNTALLKENEIKKDPNELYVPFWYDDYNLIFNFIIPYLISPCTRDNHYKNNPNRFKQVFESVEKKKDFIELLTFSLQNAPTKLSFFSEFIQSELNLLEQNKTIIDESTNNKIVLKKQLLEVAKVYRENAQEVNKKLLEDMELSPVIKIKKDLELVKKPSLKINEINPVKVFVIDSFKENKELTSSTFNHPELNDKLSKEAINKKLEASDHGTHVCGIITKTSNVDVVFDIENLHHDFKTFSLGDAKIVNLSNGLELIGFDEETIDFLLKNNDKCISVKALGNESTTFDNYGLSGLIEHEVLKKHVILVGNIMSDGETLSPSSNIPGDNKIIQSMTVFAPGTNIDSYIPIVDEKKFKELCPNMSYTNEGHAKKSGTSMATPFVSGLVATLISKFPDLPLHEIVNIVKGGCDKVGETKLFGHGLINFQDSISIGNFISNEEVIISGALDGLFLEVD